MHEFTVTVLAEHQVGMLSRITAAFARRRVHIESLTAFQSLETGRCHFTLVVSTSLGLIKKLMGQLEKQVGVLQARFYQREEIVFQEIALCKVPLEHLASGAGLSLENLVRGHHARVLVVDPQYVVVEKTGHQAEAETLFEQLQKLGGCEVVRSGRVAMALPRRASTGEFDG